MLKIIRQETRKIIRAFFHPAFVYLAIVGNSILLISTLIVYYCEKTVNPPMTSFLNCLWWGVSTITTVGYGDIVPQTAPGRLIGIILMYTGTVLFISFTGVLVAVWMKSEVEREIRPIEKEIRREEGERIRVDELLIEIRDRLDRLESRK